MKEKLMKNMGYLIVAFDIAIYFIISYIFVDKLQVNMLTIIVNGGLLFVGAIIANTALRQQGILNGRDTERYKDTLKSHLEQKKVVYTKLNRLQGWLDNDYAKLMKIGRTVFVNSAGFDYEEVFAENGKIKNGFKVEKPKPLVITKKWHNMFKLLLRLFRWMFSDDWKIYRHKKSYVRKARRYKITRLTVSDLININANKDPNDFGITEAQFNKRESTTAIISRLIFTILLQSVTFAFSGFNLAIFLTQMLSIVLILLTSIYSMFTAYSFMVKTHRETIIMKINKLEEFDFETKQLIEKGKEEGKDVISTKVSEPAQSNLVEEIHREGESGQKNDLCGDFDIGV